MVALLKKAEHRQLQGGVEFHFVLHGPAFKSHGKVFWYLYGNCHALESVKSGRTNTVRCRNYF